MKIYIPYSELLDATLISLIGYEIEPVEVEGVYGYSKYFKQRWEEGQSFINVEHDCVIWPGAIESLEQCEKNWCVFDYSLPAHRMRNLENEATGIPLGCMKITSTIINATKNCWDNPVEWSYCDQRLTKYLLAKGLQAHQHYPGIVNANKELVKLVRR